jgi:hypothetical protein
MNPFLLLLIERLFDLVIVPQLNRIVDSLLNLIPNINEIPVVSEAFESFKADPTPETTTNLATAIDESSLTPADKEKVASLLLQPAVDVA